MRNAAGAIIAIALLAAAVLGASAQTVPGTILAGDNSGTIWQIDKKGVVTTFAAAKQAVYGLEVDYKGNVLVGGSAAVGMIDAVTKVTTLIKSGTPMSSLIGDIHMSNKGTFYVTCMGNNLVLEMDHKGTVVTQHAMTGSSRTWGMGLDKRAGILYVGGSYILHALDLNTGKVTNAYTGTSTALFVQGACWGPTGRVAIGDERKDGLYEWDPVTKKITVLQLGPPFADPGEGVDWLSNGDYVLSDDGSGISPQVNKIWQVTPGPKPVLSTLVAGAPFTDLNGITVVPELLCSAPTATPRPGTSISFQVTSCGAQHDPYVFGASLSAQRGFLLPGGKYFPLDVDPLLGLSTNNQLPTVFRGFQGVLDVGGRARLTVNIPNIPALAGVTFYVAGITIHPAAPSGIHLVSNPMTVKITT